MPRKRKGVKSRKMSSTGWAFGTSWRGQKRRATAAPSRTRRPRKRRR